LQDITAIGKVAKWVGGAVCAPLLYCPGLAVTSK
jgi:hypothetical protein